MRSQAGRQTRKVKISRVKRQKSIENQNISLGVKKSRFPRPSVRLPALGPFHPGNVAARHGDRILEMLIGKKRESEKRGHAERANDESSNEHGNLHSMMLAV